jgi:prepilin-type N-terminal cleavage/methylation domain-containing protein
MKKAFTLLEIIVVLVIIALVTTFFVSRLDNSFEVASKMKIKSDVALIRSGILKKKAQFTLLDDISSFSLDDAVSEMLNAKLFDNILDFPLVSTNSTQKKVGEWIKKSKNRYSTYLSSNEYLDYEYNDFTFKCISKLDLCEQFQ